MLLSAAWAAGVTALVLDPGLLRSGAEPADVQLGALRDEIDALRADLVVARARSSSTQAAAKQTLDDSTTAPEQAAAVAGPDALPRAAGAPPAPAAGDASARPPGMDLGAELGPADLPWGFSAVSEPSTYRLTQGEALEHVAVRFGTTVEAIAAANGIRDVDNVPVGMLLVLP